MKEFGYLIQLVFGKGQYSSMSQPSFSSWEADFEELNLSHMAISIEGYSEGNLKCNKFIFLSGKKSYSSSYYRNANQNYNEIPPCTLYLLEWLFINKASNNECWRGCGENEPSLTAGGNVNWYSHCGKQ